MSHIIKQIEELNKEINGKKEELESLEKSLLELKQALKKDPNQALRGTKIAEPYCKNLDTINFLLANFDGKHYIDGNNKYVINLMIGIHNDVTRIRFDTDKNIFDRIIKDTRERVVTILLKNLITKHIDKALDKWCFYRLGIYLIPSFDNNSLKLEILRRAHYKYEPGEEKGILVDIGSQKIEFPVKLYTSFDHNYYSLDLNAKFTAIESIPLDLNFSKNIEEYFIENSEELMKSIDVLLKLHELEVWT